MAKRIKQRLTFHSVFRTDHWEVTQAGDTVSFHKTQREAEQAAAFAGRAVWNAGGLGKAVFHQKNSAIRAERMFGANETASEVTDKLATVLTLTKEAANDIRRRPPLSGPLLSNSRAKR